MFYFKKILIVLAALSLVWGATALAQDPTNAAQETGAEENIQPQDLSVGDPQILPDSPLYAFKNLWRGVRTFFAINPLAKAELKLKFANEKLVEAEKLINLKKDQQIIKEAIENYKKTTEDMAETANQIKEKAAENPRVNQFLDKFTHQQILQEKVLQKLAEQVPPAVFEKIEEARQKHLEKFGEVMAKLEDRQEALQERLENKLEEAKGDRYKNFKNLEILKALEAKIPEAAKNAIIKAQENSLKRLNEDLQKMSPENQEKFKTYLEGTTVIESAKRLEILDNLKEKLEAKPELRTKIMEAQEKIKEKMATTSPASRVQPCIQVIVSAVNPQGECKVFSNPCAVPEGWKTVRQCPNKLLEKVQSLKNLLPGASTEK